MEPGSPPPSTRWTKDSGSPPPSTRWTKGSEGSSPPPSRWTRGEDGAASPSPLVTNKQRIPASPMLANNNNTNKVASNTSSKQTNKLVSKQSPGSLISASESRTGSKVKISFQKSRSNIFFCSTGFALGWFRDWQWFDGCDERAALGSTGSHLLPMEGEVCPHRCCCCCCRCYC